MRMIFGSRKFALTCTQLRCWATVALQSKHQLRHWQSCSCTCWSSWCSICRSCRHTPLWYCKPQSSSLALAPWSRTLVKNIRHVCEHICDYSLWGCCTSNMEFKAVLRQLCLLIFCSRSTLPKALFEPCPPGQRNKFANEILKMICLRTGLANPEQYHKCRILAVTPTSTKHLGELPDVLGKSWQR